jgi:hypothetical protein
VAWAEISRPPVVVYPQQLTVGKRFTEECYQSIAIEIHTLFASTSWMARMALHNDFCTPSPE